MKRSILLCGCLIGPVAASALWRSARGIHAAHPAAICEVVERGDVDIKVTETGTVEPLRKVEVKSKVAGRIIRLYASEGERVHAGQLIGEIEPEEIDSQAAQIRSQLAGAQAHLEQSQRQARYQVDQTRLGIRQAEEAVRAAQAHVQAADEERIMQANLAESAVAQAEATLDAALQSQALLERATHPQAAVDARSGYEEAHAGAERATRSLARQLMLAGRGYAAAETVDAARADVASAQARLDQARKRLELLSEQLRLELADAKSRAAQARAALQNARAGRGQAAVKEQEARAARAALEQAREQQQVALAGGQQDLMREDDVKQAQASTSQLECQLREVQLRRRDTRLIAPMDGIVTRRFVEPGELVTSATSGFSTGTPIVQIADLSQMLVRLSINEVDVQPIRPGIPVEIIVDGAAGAVYPGRVCSIAPTGSGAPGTDAAAGGGASVVRFAVDVAVVSVPGATPLKPGMSARCAIFVARRQNVLRLPAGCVETSGTQASVQVVPPAGPDGKRSVPVTRTVTLGLANDSHVEIVSGLREGERVKAAPYHGPARAGIEVGGS